MDSSASSKEVQHDSAVASNASKDGQTPTHTEEKKVEESGHAVPPGQIRVTTTVTQEVTSASDLVHADHGASRFGVWTVISANDSPTTQNSTPESGRKLPRDSSLRSFSETDGCTGNKRKKE